MHKIVDKLTYYCLNEELIKSEDVPWFKYGLEKRISTIIVGIPFLIIAFLISSFLCAVSFFASYFFVRKYIGGYHAKSVLGCIFFSLLMEIVFLGCLPYLINTPFLSGIHVISIVAVFLLAPYNHPNMHLSLDEITVCKKKGRHRICIATLICLIVQLAEGSEIAKGCTIGIVMAATLLCFGYIFNWRNTYHEDQRI